MKEPKSAMPIISAVAKELARARKEYEPFNSNHEGYAVILEEVDELWAEIKKSHGVKASDQMKKECIQVAAMAIRFVLDLGGDE